MDTIKEILGKIIDKLLEPKREAKLEVKGLDFVYDDAAKGYKFVQEKDLCRHAPVVRLLDCKSLVHWCKAIGGPNEDVEEPVIPLGQVVISREEDTVAQTPIFAQPHCSRECAHKVFFMGFLPNEKFEEKMGFEDMLAWIDLLGDDLDDAENIQTALKSVSAIGSVGTTIEQDGAVILFKGVAENGVKFSARMPKRLQAKIPFGDPACVLDVEFSMQIKVENGGVSFKLRHLVSDGAFDKYAAWMSKELEALPEGWLVMVGP